MSDNTPKKRGRPPKKKKEIEEMAAQVFAAQEEQEEIETPKTKTKPIPNAETLQRPDKNEKPEPVKFTQGLTRPTAFLIQKHALLEIDAILGQHFGKADYDYFVHCENTMTLSYKGKPKKYKSVLVEDKNGYRYNLWFDLSAIGPFGY